MALDERARHELYLRLEEHLGSEAATTLMEHLPPTGWADVATKRDLDHQAALMQRDMESVRSHIEKSVERASADLHKAISTHTIAIVFAMAATILAVAQIR